MGTETRDIYSAGSRSPWALPSCAPNGPAQPLLGTHLGGWVPEQAGCWPARTSLSSPSSDNMTGMGKSPAMVSLHLHQARLGISSWHLGVLLPQNREHLPCIIRCLSLVPPAGLDQGKTHHRGSLVPSAPSGISAHPKTLLNPGSCEQRDRLGCVWLAEGEGTPGHLLRVMEVGHVCGLGHHHVGCSLPEGVYGHG